MKYMILTYASQKDYDAMAGKATGTPVWSGKDFAAMGAFMEAFNKELAESGELVETRGLAAPSTRAGSNSATVCRPLPTGRSRKPPRCSPATGSWSVTALTERRRSPLGWRSARCLPVRPRRRRPTSAPSWNRATSWSPSESDF